MKILKIILAILVALIALVLIAAAVMPKDYSITVETTIARPKAQVRDYTKLFANQVHYSVRVMADPDVKLTYAGTDGTIGAKQSRDSAMKDVGAGEQEITAIDEGNSIEVEIRFKRPMEGINYAKSTYEDIGDGKTKVSQVFRGKNPRPMNLISMLFLPKVEQDMQQNMDNLKRVIEAQPVLPTILTGEQADDTIADQEVWKFAPMAIQSITGASGMMTLMVDVLSRNPDFQPGLTDFFLNNSKTLREVTVTNDTLSYECMGTGTDDNATTPDTLVPTSKTIEMLQKRLSTTGEAYPTMYMDIEDKMVKAFYEQCLP